MRTAQYLFRRFSTDRAFLFHNPAVCAPVIGHSPVGAADDTVRAPRGNTRA